MNFLTGASLLALAKSIYYAQLSTMCFSNFLESEYYIKEFSFAFYEPT